MDRLCSVYVLLFLAFWAWKVGTSTQYIKVYQEMEGCSLLVTVQTRPKGDFRVRVARHCWKGLRCCAIQVPKRLASPMRVVDPLGLRVPPLILRATTKGRILRSARLLWAGTPGTATKTNSSGKKRSNRSHKVC